MAKRILNRRDLRAQAEAAERIKGDDEEREEDDEEEEEDEDEDKEASDAEGGEAGEDGAEGDDEEVVVKKKPKKAPAKAKVAKVTKPRTRTAKHVRMQVVWGVFSNSNQRVAVYPYKQEREAREHALKLSTDKKTTFFVQPVKEPMEEKKE